MAKTLFFINKNGSSNQLSSSNASEAREIRSHAQKGLRHVSRASAKVSKAQRPSEVAAPPPPSNGPHSIVLRFDHDPVRAEKASSRKRRTTRPEGVVATASEQTHSHSFYLLPRALALADLGLTEDEHISLSLYVSRTAVQWSGWNDVHFWTSLALQACAQSKAVAHTLISFAALDRGSDQNLPPNCRAPFRLLALRQASKAVIAFRASRPSKLVCLVLNVISVCLQNFLDTRKAQHLIQSGTRALKLFQISSDDLEITRDDRHVAETYIRPLMHRLETRYCVIIDAVAAFARSVQVSRIRSDAKHELPVIPQHFESLSAAKDCVAAILAWGHDAVPDSDSSSDEMHRFRDRAQEFCNAWLSAFNASTTSSSSAEKQSATRSGQLLRVALLHGQILLSTYNTPTETLFDEYIPQFRLITALLQDMELSNKTEGRQNFGIDSGLLDIIAFVVQRCRDPLVRKTMLNLLETSERIEGDRVSSIGSNILRVLVEAEEGDDRPATAADIPEERRFRTFEDHQYFGLGQIRVLMLSAPYRIDKGARVVERWADIPTTAFLQTTKLAPARAADIQLPNMIYGAHSAAFLQDAKGSYYQFSFERFYFPIPRV